SAVHIPVDHGSHEDLEESVVNFGDEDIRKGVDKCSKCLIGKLLSNRSFSVGTLETALQAIWKQPKGFRGWEESLEIKETTFINVPMWIQLWGVPEHCKTKTLAIKVGGALGRVLDANLFQFRSGDERILKVKIQLD
ncbi:hypothetical protein PIB30_098567, partial [Stylosanthes scabra]|nr:hypothetical protein [Stylosanthes scabra]